ncbi:reverse transcriptase domain-containing protein, partial [Tanacetum coccineum]
GVSYDGPTIQPTSSPLPKEVERESEATKDKVQTTSLGSTAHVQPLVVQVPIPELDFLQIFQRLHFDISFADALLHMPKFASTFKSRLSNKEKLFKLASTPLNENCLAVFLKKLLEKLGDPSKFLIPCDFLELDECLALADLGASINLMPLSVWKKLSLSKLMPTRMTLELANRSVTYPLVLSKMSLTARALIDVHGEELILRDGDEQLIFHVDNTSKHPNKHESINMINFIDFTCEDRFFEVLKFKKSNHPSSGSTTPLSDSLLKEFADELALCDPFPPGNEDDNFDSEANLRKIEYLLNREPLTESSPKSDIEIIDPILKRITDKPAHVYSFPPGDDDDDNNDLFMTSLLVLPVVEPEDYFIMRDEDLRFIPEKESDEFIKSSVEDLV